MLGYYETHVLRTAGNGATRHAILARLQHVGCSQPAGARFITRLLTQGLIEEHGRQVRLTAAGWAIVGQGTSIPMPAYRPPAALPVRPGAMDFVRCPSVYAGRP